MRMGFKFGSSCLTNANGGLAKDKVLRICGQIADLNKAHHDEVFLVTSGAVASDPYYNREKNLRASVGMARLMGHYVECFNWFGVEVGQILITDQDLHQGYRTNLMRLFNECFKNGVIPIINANDAIDCTELNRLDECADNDVLFMNLCLELTPNIAVIGIDEDGLLDDNGDVISIVDANNFPSVLDYCCGGNEAGHGDSGMLTKVQVAKHLASFGIKTILAPTHDDNFVEESVNQLALLDDPLTISLGTFFDFREKQRKFDFMTDEIPKILTLGEMKAQLGYSA